jgi:hypothetical protein
MPCFICPAFIRFRYLYRAVKGKIEEQGNPSYIGIGITDQYGKKYKIKMNINSAYSDKTK